MKNGMIFEDWGNVFQLVTGGSGSKDALYAGCVSMKSSNLDEFVKFNEEGYEWTGEYFLTSN